MTAENGKLLTCSADLNMTCEMSSWLFFFFAFTLNRDYDFNLCAYIFLLLLLPKQINHYYIKILSVHEKTELLLSIRCQILLHRGRKNITKNRLYFSRKAGVVELVNLGQKTYQKV